MAILYNSLMILRLHVTAGQEAEQAGAQAEVDQAVGQRCPVRRDIIDEGAVGALEVGDPVAVRGDLETRDDDGEGWEGS